jgi:endonuclease YncB( thermonuclease family)
MFRRFGLLFLSAAMLAVAIGGAAASADEVIDGNTLVVEGQRMRLYGIDAFALEQTCLDAHDQPWRCGTAAKAALAELVQGQAVACTVVDDSQDGVYVARCTVRDNVDLGTYLVRAGLALADRRAGNDYVAAEQAARAARAGAWSGTFTPPWQWREEQHKR